jgi:hypothetical protein
LKEIASGRVRWRDWLQPKSIDVILSTEFRDGFRPGNSGKFPTSPSLSRVETKSWMTRQCTATIMVPTLSLYRKSNRQRTGVLLWFCHLWFYFKGGSGPRLNLKPLFGVNWTLKFLRACSRHNIPFPGSSGEQTSELVIVGTMPVESRI